MPLAGGTEAASGVQPFRGSVAFRNPQPDDSGATVASPRDDSVDQASTQAMAAEVALPTSRRVWHRQADRPTGIHPRARPGLCRCRLPRTSPARLRLRPPAPAAATRPRLCPSRPSTWSRRRRARPSTPAAGCRDTGPIRLRGSGEPACRHHRRCRGRRQFDFPLRRPLGRCDGAILRPPESSAAGMLHA